MAGGSATGRARILVQEEDFDPSLLLAEFADRRTGALVSFLGLARDCNDGHVVERITLEHYPGMTQRSLEDIARRALARWPVRAILIVHRYGSLVPGERIVLVAVASVHRQEAFAACAYLVDHLKTEAPFWKREFGPMGARWVEARPSDAQVRDQGRAP